jgi:HPt (histidine-containing phosphotransfer) domain-containing protein
MLMALRTAEATSDARGLAASYLQFCAAHLDELESYIAHHDKASVLRIAHTLSDNARCTGLSEISSLGRQLEQYCAGNDWSAIFDTFEVIAETIEQLCASRAKRVEVHFDEPGEPQAFEVKCR